jgi:hypothetical protein
MRIKIIHSFRDKNLHKIVRFVDIGGIVDHSSLKFIFIIHQNMQIRARDNMLLV